MAGAEIHGENKRRSSSLSGEDISHYKRSLLQNSSPKSPLSPESPSSGSIDLTIDETVDNSIELLYQNICDMASSNDTHSICSFTTYGNESRIDSELRHLVGADTDTEEDVKEVIKEEHKEVSDDINTPPRSKKKVGKTIKGGIHSRVKSLPSVTSKLVCNSPNVKSMSPKPPIGKRNAVKSSRGSFLCTSPFQDEKNGNGKKSGKKMKESPYLGPYLLKKARDVISTGDDPKRAFELALRAKQSFEDCGSDKPNLDYVMCLHVLASMYCSLGQRNEAIPLLQRSIEVPKPELGQMHALAKFVGCMQLGDLYAMKGQIENSIVQYKTALEVQKQVLGEQDPRFGETCRYVAEAHVQAFDFDEAEKFCQMALDIHKANKGSPISIEEAADRRLMGLICESKGNYEAALEHYVLASTALSDSGLEADIAALDCNIGDAYLTLARYDEAIFSYQKALTELKSCKGENHPAVGTVFVRLAELYNKIGKFTDSKSYCEKALRIYEKAPPGSNTEDIASGLIDLSAIYESMNELDQAFNLLSKAVDLYGDSPGQQQCMIAGIEAQMGVIHYMQGKYADSYDCLNSSISKFQASGEKKSSIYGITLNQLGLACVQLYSIGEAAALFEEAKSVLEKEYGLYHPDTLAVYSNLAGTYDALGRWDEAIDLLDYVVGMREEKLGTADPVVDDEKRRLSELLKEARRARRRKSRSLETLLDKNSQIMIKNVAGPII